MNHRFAVVCCVLVLACGMAWAGHSPKFVVGSGLLEYLETTVPPEVRCTHGEPTGSFPPCTAGSTRYFSRSEEQIWSAIDMSPSIESMLDGPITFVINCNFDANYRGPCWGTFSWEETGGGIWVGQWAAPLMDLITYESKISMTGFGTGGTIDGKHLKVDGFSNAGDYYITMSARIDN